MCTWMGNWIGLPMGEGDKLKLVSASLVGV